jgi:hypothetical protein
MSTFLSSGGQGSPGSARYVRAGHGKLPIRQDRFLVQDFADEVVRVISAFPIEENVDRLVEFRRHGTHQVTAEGLIADGLFCASEKRTRALQSGDVVGHLFVGLGKASIELPS